MNEEALYGHRIFYLELRLVGFDSGESSYVYPYEIEFRLWRVEVLFMQQP
ncbi:MAG: hypothetical protein AAF960_19620 [Bacteroidota bacterium]